MSLGEKTESLACTQMVGASLRAEWRELFLLVLGDFSAISGLSALSSSDHGHVSVFFSQPSCNTCNFHRGVLFYNKWLLFWLFRGEEDVSWHEAVPWAVRHKGTAPPCILGCGHLQSLPPTGPQEGYNGGSGLPSWQRGEPMVRWTLTPPQTPVLLFHDFCVTLWVKVRF